MLLLPKRQTVISEYDVFRSPLFFIVKDKKMHENELYSIHNEKLCYEKGDTKLIFMRWKKLRKANWAATKKACNLKKVAISFK